MAPIPKTDINDKQYLLLRVNKVVGGICLLAGSVAFVALTKSNCTLPTHVTLETWDGNVTEGQCVQTKQQTFVSVSNVGLSWAVAFSAFWSALCLLWTATKWRWSAYKENIRNEAVVVRWVDYILSSPSMMVVIVYLSGNTQTWTLVGVAMQQAFVIYVGGFCDNPLRPPIRRMGNWFMAFLGTCVSWGICFDALRLLKPPSFVVVIVVCQFLLFLTFGILQFVSILLPEKRYELEFAWDCTSGAAKTVLLWTTQSGLFARTGSVSLATIGVATGVPITIYAVVCGIFIFAWKRAEKSPTISYGSLGKRIVGVSER